MPIGIVIGLGAGLVSAALFVSASTGTMLGLFVLLLLAPLPVAIAGLGWGWLAGLTAAATGAGVAALALLPKAIVFYAVAMGVPPAFLAYLLLLARGPADRSGRPAAAQEWYPVGRVVAWAALWAGVLSAMALFATAPDVESLRAALKAGLERLALQPIPLPSGNDQPIGAREIDALTDLMAASFAGVTASGWMVMILVNLWLAGLVASASGRLSRPWPVLSAIALPRGLPLGVAAAFAGSFAPGYAGLIASGFAAAFVLAYALVGLAIIHVTTNGLTLRPVILAVVYAAVIVLNWIGLPLLALIGLAEPFSPLRRPVKPGSGGG